MDQRSPLRLSRLSYHQLAWFVIAVNNSGLSYVYLYINMRLIGNINPCSCKFRNWLQEADIYSVPNIYDAHIAN